MIMSRNEMFARGLMNILKIGHLNPIPYGLWWKLNIWGVKLPLQSKIFKNDAKKLTMALKLENTRSSPEYEGRNWFQSLFSMMSALFRQKITKNGQILSKFHKCTCNDSNIICKWLLAKWFVSMYRGCAL